MHNKGEELNETWTKLLKELNFYGDIDDHTLYLRKRWVLGASQLLSGKHGSKVNDQEVYGYTENEWTFIWSTMNKNGAWSVENIRDKNGKDVKNNFAPEMLMKFIAHDIKCHIIIFDLKLNIVQFCSANHIKDNNCAFDSPLLLYYTGNHFQSVFPKNQEYFIGYAKQLEKEYNPNPTAAKEEEKTILKQQLFHHKQIPRSMDEVSAKVFYMILNSY